MENPYFKQLENTIHETSETSVGEGLSWRRLTAVESEVVIECALAQGTIVTRPSKRLDHADERTKQLPPHEQLEYKYVTEHESETATNQNMAQRSSTTVPDELPDPRQQQMDSLKQSLNKLVKQWHDQRDDYNVRIRRYANNACSGFQSQMHLVHFDK